MSCGVEHTDESTDKAPAQVVALQGKWRDGRDGQISVLLQQIQERARPGVRSHAGQGPAGSYRFGFGCRFGCSLFLNPAVQRRQGRRLTPSCACRTGRRRCRRRARRRARLSGARSASSGRRVGACPSAGRRLAPRRAPHALVSCPAPLLHVHRGQTRVAVHSALLSGNRAVLMRRARPRWEAARDVLLEDAEREREKLRREEAQARRALELVSAPPRSPRRPVGSGEGL